MSTIAIIGAGFSGTLLALNLLRRVPPGTTIKLIERQPVFGLGLAYSTPNASHLLNVRAGGMSAFRDQPGHFVQWLNESPHRWGEPRMDAAKFVPRQVYGAYLGCLLTDAAKGAGFHGKDRAILDLVAGEVTDVAMQSGKPMLTLQSGRQITADIAVFATGNAPPLADQSGYGTDCYRADPWAPGALTDLDPDAPVLLIGTGLTAMDVVLTLLDQGHRGRIHALSRRGLLPQPHAAIPMVSTARTHFPVTAVGLLRSLRQEARAAMQAGRDWRPIVDSLRPATSDIWQVMSVADRARFLRHARPWWDTHRHRMAPEIAARIEAARQRGQFLVQAGRILGITPDGADAQVRYRLRGAEYESTTTVARIVNCSGPGSDYRRLADPVVRALLAQGLARPDPLRLGLDVTANCALRGEHGAVSRQLYAVGPLTKSVFWEMVAVPDIRRQTELLSAHLSGMLLSPDAEGAEGLTEPMFVI
jgi:uncharacterized NAD(P)/FAD-binding protein YdhS